MGILKILCDLWNILKNLQNVFFYIVNYLIRTIFNEYKSWRIINLSEIFPVFQIVSQINVCIKLNVN